MQKLGENLVRSVQRGLCCTSTRGHCGTRSHSRDFQLSCIIIENENERMLTENERILTENERISIENEWTLIEN
mgnify:CR=1 FL=1